MTDYLKELKNIIKNHDITSDEKILLISKIIEKKCKDTEDKWLELIEKRTFKGKIREYSYHAGWNEALKTIKELSNNSPSSRLEDDDKEKQMSSSAGTTLSNSEVKE